MSVSTGGMEHTMRVAAVERLSPRATLLRAEPGRPFPFAAGQAVMVGLATQAIRKPYSIANSPGAVRDAGVLELLIGHDDSGGPGQHLTPIAVGSILGVSAPMGRFGVPSRIAGRSLVFIAGGTGIAPLRSMIGDVMLRLPPLGVSLLYSARTPADLAFHRQFENLRDDARLTYVPTITREPGTAWPGRRGRIDRTLVQEIVAPGSICLVCGPPVFNTDVTALLAELGVAPSRVLTERY